jgi:hypothetical protein
MTIAFVFITNKLSHFYWLHEDMGTTHWEILKDSLGD